MKISGWLSLSEWIETSCWHQSWWTNNVVFLYPGLPAARGQCHGSLEIFLYPSSFLVVFRITNQRNNSIEKLETLLFALIYNTVISKMKEKVCFTVTSDFQFESRLSLDSEVKFFQIVSKIFLFSPSFTFPNWFLFISPNFPNPHFLTSHALITGSL